ncbi:sulfite exporter TauE/SafE family protein [Litoreibacter arenae]|nr:sulfite exporter TauE/SafE family protein [Litoreibacter arenae]
MTLFEILLLLSAAFGAGVLNTIAGGGTFLTFPALVFVGIPPVVANATSTVAVLPGYLGGALGFRKEVMEFDRKQLIRLIVIGLLGGAVGSVLLLISSDRAFSALVPFLLLIATFVFLFGAQIRAWAARRSQSVTPFGAFGMFAVSTYGGYFNGGLGIILLALFSLWGMTNIYQMNGLKTAMSFILSAISVAIFAGAGIIEWKAGLMMMVASTAGGYAGAPISKALPMPVVRGIVATVGFAMSGVFFWRVFVGG